MERAAIEIGALDEQVGKKACGPQLAYLSPQSSLDDRGMQVANALALDQCVLAYGVVTGRQRCNLDLNTEFGEEERNPALVFMGVHDDPNRGGPLARHGAVEMVPGTGLSLSARAERP
jgi:hypothetical protein